MRFLRSPLAAFCALLALSGCGGDAHEEDGASSSDPLLARALNDPLMVDPDLAYRNESNAAITIGFDHALPPIEGTLEAGLRARDAARSALLDGGPIIALPELPEDSAGVELVEARSSAADMAMAYGASGSCVGALTHGYAWAARLPEPAQIMPHGQVQQAAGADRQGCTLKVVRYATAAEPRDALEFHYNLAERAGLAIELISSPDQIIRAHASAGDKEQLLAVHAREGRGAMTYVDLIYWSN